MPLYAQSRATMLWLHLTGHANKIMILMASRRRSLLLASALVDIGFVTREVTAAADGSSFLKDHPDYKIVIADEIFFKFVHEFRYDDPLRRLVVLVDSTLHDGLGGLSLMKHGASVVVLEGPSFISDTVAVALTQKQALQSQVDDTGHVLMSALHKNIVKTVNQSQMDQGAAICAVRRHFSTIYDGPLHIYKYAGAGRRLVALTDSVPRDVILNSGDELECLGLTDHDLCHIIPYTGIFFVQAAPEWPVSVAHRRIFSGLCARLHWLLEALESKQPSAHEQGADGGPNPAVALIHNLLDPVQSLSASTREVAAASLNGSMATLSELKAMEQNIDTIILLLQQAQSSLVGDPTPSSSHASSSCDIVTAACAAVRARQDCAQGAITIHHAPIGYTKAPFIDLVQILQNLLSNAFNAIHGGPHGGDRIVVVTVRGEPGRLFFEVSNHGPSLPPEIRDNLFTNHFTTHPSPQYHGIGLSQARMLLQKLGGSIYYRRDAERNIFGFEVPAAEGLSQN